MGLITSRLVSVKPYGQARIVTIVATGKSTGTPQPSARSKPERPAFLPTEYGCPVRILSGREFQKRAAELMARDAAERRRGVV